MAAPSTPGGSPKLGPAFSPKAAGGDAAAGTSASAAGPSGDGSEAHAGGCSVRCPYCDEVLPSSFLAQVRSTEELDPQASEGLQKSVQGGDGAETSATKAGISAADIRRWSERAGLELPPPSPTAAPVPDEPKDHAKPIPILAPPPPPAAKNKGRFGFFSRKSEPEDSEDDDDLDDLVTGYAKLDEGPDDDNYEEKPIVFKKREPEPDSQPKDEPKTSSESAARPPQSSSSLNDPTLAVAAGASEPELRLLLKEVLGRISSLVSFATS